MSRRLLAVVSAGLAFFGLPQCGRGDARVSGRMVAVDSATGKELWSTTPSAPNGGDAVIYVGLPTLRGRTVEAGVRYAAGPGACAPEPPALLRFDRSTGSQLGPGPGPFDPGPPVGPRATAVTTPSPSQSLSADTNEALTKSVAGRFEGIAERTSADD